MATDKVSRVLAGRYPPPGTSPIADAIRDRRGPHGITPLDAALLHVPPVAGGWNTLGSAVRSQGKLPGDVRELLILRVAVINRAAFEWIQHEDLGRESGLNNAQLYIVRDESTPLPPAPGIFSELQTSALMFADASTKNVKVGDQITITNALKKYLGVLARHQNAENIEERTEDLFAEVALVVAVYNMVSRFLVATDVAGLSDDPVPWPIERKEHFVPLPNSHMIHAVTITTSVDAPWIVFANSLLTNLHMWDLVIPHLISDSPNIITGKPRKPYNVLIHSQRGHGKSTLPDFPTATTIASLASDIAHLLSTLKIPTPVHAIVGVSQGGAASLAFARSYPELTRSIVACDTSPKGNREAWAGRIGVVYGGVSAVEILRKGVKDGEVGKGADYAVKVGMGKLANSMVVRWFPLLLKDVEKEPERGERHKWVTKMMENTPVHGFVAGVEGVSDYDLYQADENSRTLFTSPVERVLLLAGSLDGGGNIGKGLQHLRDEWNTVRRQSRNAKPVEYVEIMFAGHLPMIDEAERFAEVLRSFLDSF